jgi:hypothetical protein
MEMIATRLQNAFSSSERQEAIVIKALPLRRINLATLAQFRVGRVVLHLLALLGDRSVRFHVEGIARELPWMAAGLAVLTRLRIRLLDALTLYLAQPLANSVREQNPQSQSLATQLVPGDVLLTQGNSRVAAIIRSVTRSPWSHVSLYVGPLSDDPDPQCIVEADIAAGVRSIRLSELNALQVRILRPIGLTESDRRSLADWAVGRIGSEYDLPHALNLLRNRLRQLLPLRVRSTSRAIASNATRFICCSLLAHAFAFVGYPLVPGQVDRTAALTGDSANLVPSDFERAPRFEVVGPSMS